MSRPNILNNLNFIYSSIFFYILLKLRLEFVLLFESYYRVIHKSLRDFRTRLRNNQDRRGRKEHINR